MPLRFALLGPAQEVVSYIKIWTIFSYIVSKNCIKILVFKFRSLIYLEFICVDGIRWGFKFVHIYFSPHTANFFSPNDLENLS